MKWSVTIRAGVVVMLALLCSRADGQLLHHRADTSSDAVVAGSTYDNHLKNFRNRFVKRTVYTLKECYALALERNLTQMRVRNEVRIAGLERKTAVMGVLPSAYYNAGHRNSYGKNIDPVTNVFVNERFSGGYMALEVDLEVFSGFERIHTIRQAGYALQAMEYSAKRAEIDLLTQVTQLYARLLAAKEQIGIEQNNISNIEQQLKIVQEKIKVGRLTNYEAYTFNARLNTHQANLVALQNDSLSATQELRQVLNLGLREAIDIASIDSADIEAIVSTEISSELLVERLLQEHPAVREAEMWKEAARMGEKVARSRQFPSISVGGNVVSNYNMNQTTNGQKIPVPRQIDNNLGQNFNVNIRIPIFSQMENINNVRRERINFQNAEFARQDMQNTIVTTTIQLINDFNAARQAYIATRNSWQQNTLSHRMYAEKYKLGQISAVEMLTSQDVLNASAARFVQAKLELFVQYQVVKLLNDY